MNCVLISVFIISSLESKSARKYAISSPFIHAAIDSDLCKIRKEKKNEKVIKN